jgi:serpin B
LRALHIDQPTLPQALDQTYGASSTILTALREQVDKYGLPLNVATRLSIRRDIRPWPDYVSILRDVFRAPPLERDNRVATGVSVIDAWAKEVTQGRISQIFGSRTATAPVVLASVAYLGWNESYQWILDSKFSNSPAKTAGKTRLMRRVRHLGYAEVDGAKLIEMSHGGVLSMIVVLPDDPDGLEKIENRLGGRYDEWLAAMASQKVDLALPRFSTTTELALVDVLKAMGIAHAFDPREARLWSMANPGAGESARPAPYVGDAIQKTRIETEATPIKGPFFKREYYDPLEASGLRLPPATFHANHPFMYLVRDVKTGAILFMGHVVKPTP